MTLRLMLVDDHPAILLGLTALFDADPGLTVVAAVRSAADAVATYVRVRPDVVVLDLSMPGLDGLEVLRQIRARDTSAAVLVLTSTSDPERVEELLAAGAHGFMRKDCSPDELVSAVGTVAGGDLPLDPRLTRALLERRPPVATEAAELTDRELEVLHLVAQGLANKQIATRLGIGASTVKTHLSSAFHRIGVADRTSAAIWVQAHDGRR